MTSHKGMLKGHSRDSKDELGALLQWSLQETVAGVSPPPEVWERIRARAERPAVWRRAGFHKSYRIAMAQLSRVGAFLSAQMISWMWPQGRWVEWKFDPRFTHLLFDQYGFFWLRLAF